MKKNLIRFGAVAGTVAVSLLPFVAAAQFGSQPPTIPGTPVTTVGGALNVICIIFRWLFWLLVILAVIFVIIAAFKYLTAAGDTEKVKSANHQLVYAAVAIVVALIAVAFPRIVFTFVGGSGTLTTC